MDKKDILERVKEYKALYVDERLCCCQEDFTSNTEYLDNFIQFLFEDRGPKYDFYFSLEEEKEQFAQQKPIFTVKGKQFTRKILSGKRVNKLKYKDLKFVGTGYKTDIRIYKEE